MADLAGVGVPQRVAPRFRIAGGDWTPFILGMNNNAPQAMARVGPEIPAAAGVYAEVAAQWKAIQEKRAAAAAKAGQLLLSHLTPEQAAQYNLYAHFDVTGSAGGQYRIANTRSPSMNITILADSLSMWPPGTVLCAYPEADEDGYLPIGDVLLAQALSLKADEPGFRAIAVPSAHTAAQQVQWGFAANEAYGRAAPFPIP